jgi:hypothetical protein
MSKLAELRRRAKRVYQNEGPVSLLLHGLRSLQPVRYGTYWLYESDIAGQLSGQTEAECMPRIKDFTLIILTSEEQAAGLEAGGLRLGLRLDSARRALDKGAVALCIFVDGQLAHAVLLAMTDESKRLLDPLPYRVDFANNEACTANAWTSPSYRRLRLQRYSAFKTLEFLNGRGVVTGRYATAKRNVAIQGGPARFGDRPYAEGRFFRVLWWKWWKERPLTAGE